MQALNEASASNFQPILYVAVHELAHGQYKIGMSKMRLKVCGHVCVWYGSENDVYVITSWSEVKIMFLKMF